MILKYDIEIETTDIVAYLARLTNQIYKLLPSREEGLNWQKSLNMLLIEIKGFNSLLSNHSIVLALISKLEGLSLLTDEDDFMVFRSIVFDCLGLLETIKKQLQ